MQQSANPKSCLVEFKGICGENMLIDVLAIEFAYPIQMLGQEVVYIGMKTGKKLFVNSTMENFSLTVKQYKDE